MFAETYAERKENDQIRMGIIRGIMSIYDTKRLKNIQRLVEIAADKECPDHPMTIDQLASEIDFEDGVKILDAVKNSEGLVHDNARAYIQLFQAFADTVDKYTGAA
jgi:hypothetical protein